MNKIRRDDSYVRFSVSGFAAMNEVDINRLTDRLNNNEVNSTDVIQMLADTGHIREVTLTQSRKLRFTL